MEQVTLAVATRDEKGTRPAKRLRAQGRVPATVYGHGMQALSVSVPQRELFAALRTESGLNALIELTVEGGEKVLTVAREIQRHPVRGEITHLDFIQVSLDEVISAEVSVDYVGTPAPVAAGEAIIETIENTVTISAIPTAIPGSIEYDISALEIGDTVRLSDLPAIEGVAYVGDEDRPLLTLIIPRAEIEEEPEEAEALEGEEGDESEDAPGDGAGEASGDSAESDEG